MLEGGRIFDFPESRIAFLFSDFKVLDSRYSGHEKRAPRKKSSMRRGTGQKFLLQIVILSTNSENCTSISNNMSQIFDYYC